MREFGFEPRSTADAFNDFITGRGLRGRDAVRAAEAGILAAIRQVRATAGDSRA